MQNQAKTDKAALAGGSFSSFSICILISVIFASSFKFKQLSYLSLKISQLFQWSAVTFSPVSTLWPSMTEP